MIQKLLYVLLLMVTIIKYPLDLLVYGLYSRIVKYQVSDMKKYAEDTLGVKLDEHNIRKEL